jgi:ribosome-binding factor A
MIVEKQFSRLDRIGSSMQKELSKIIQSAIHDPRVGIVTISEVRVTKDLAQAKIYMSMLAPSEKEIQEAIDVLNHASGFIKSQLAKVLTIRKIPELHFIFDKSIIQGPQLSALIDNAIEEDKKFHENND